MKIKGFETRPVVITISPEQRREITESYNKDTATLYELLSAVEAAIVRDFKPNLKNNPQLPLLTNDEQITFRQYAKSNDENSEHSEWGLWNKHYYGSDIWKPIQKATELERAMFDAACELRHAIYTACLAQEPHNKSS